MKLATIRSKEAHTLDGRLVVVNSTTQKVALLPTEPFPNLLHALDHWKLAEPYLQDVSKKLLEGNWKDTAAFTEVEFMAPLPRTWAFLDGSAFIQHVILVRKARGAEPPEDLYTIPLMYQGLSDNFLGPTDDIPLIDESHGMDFEAEVGFILGPTTMGTKASDAAKSIRLAVLLNDISLRNLIPRELATSFGFFHGKPPSSFAPFAITLDELGDSWKDGRVQLPVECTLNQKLVGTPHAGEMHFSFFDLIEHAAKTRPLSAGTIIGSGTISNKDENAGIACLAEIRMIEKIKTGEMKTPFMKWGDTIKIDMKKNGQSLFGCIEQKVVSA